MVEERDILQRDVFPAVQQFCLARGARFQAIDLRWGVSEQANVDQQAMNICLAEVERCRDISPRPNFIVLLGDRYGWCPLPSQIPASEFDRIHEQIESTSDRDLLDAWYPRDDNAVPALHYLRPRVGAIVSHREWTPTEQRLREILQQAVAGTELAADVRYVGSATEQEISRGALTVADASEHVFCFLRTIDGLPTDRSAGAFTDLGPDGRHDAIAGFRLDQLKRQLRSALPDNVHTYRATWRGEGPSYDHRAELAYDVRTALTRVITQELDRLEETDPLEQEVRRHAKFGAERAMHFTGRDSVLAQIATYLETGSGHPLAIHGVPGSGKSALMARASQIALRDNPVATTIERFIGATPEATNSRDLIRSLCRQIAAAWSSRRDELNDDQIGLLDPSGLPEDFQELAREFAKRLTLSSPKHPLVLFLDGLDQFPLGDPGRHLAWLPTRLPPGVRIVFSLTRAVESDVDRSADQTDSEPYQALSRRHVEFIALTPMEQREGGHLLDSWLAAAHRTLAPRQRTEVLEKFERQGLPLYLKLAFEEARAWRSDTPPDLTELSPGIPGLIRDNLLARLSADDRHGATLVAHSLGYLAAAKNGLTDDEMLDILSADASVLEDFRRRSPRSPSVSRLPPVVWSRLYFDLEPYLSERVADGASLLYFYHRQLAEIVTEEYLADDVGRQRHSALAAYFSDDTVQPLQRQPDGETTANLRRLSELPYQQAYAALWHDLYTTMTDFDFLRAKVAHADVVETANQTKYGGVYALENDYALALELTPEHASAPADSTAATESDVRISADLRRILEEWATFFRHRAHLLVLGTRAWTPDRILHQLAFEYATNSTVTRVAEAWSQQHHPPPLRRSLRPREARRRPLISVFTGHDELPDGVVSVDRHRIASWTSHYPIRIWDVDSAVELCQLRGTGEYVSSACLAPWGHLISRSEDGNGGNSVISIWDPDDGAELQRHASLGGRVYGVLPLADHRVVSWGKEPFIRIWQSDNGSEQQLRWDPDATATREGRSVFVRGGCQMADGHLALWGSDNTLRTWDLATSQEVRRFHMPLPEEVLPLTDGRLLAYWSEGTAQILIWNPEADRGFRGPADVEPLIIEAKPPSADTLSKVPWATGISGVLMLPGERLAVWAFHGPLQIWDLRSPALLHEFADRISTAAVLSDGKLASSSDREPFIRVWDINRGSEVGRLEGHNRDVKALLALPDGLLASASWDRTIRVWRAADAEAAAASMRPPRASGAVFLPDQRVVTWSEAAVGVLDPASGSESLRFEGHTDSVTRAVVLPDRWLATCSRDGTIRIWDTDSGNEIHRLYHEDVNGVVLLLDGRLASYAADGSIAIWDWHTGTKMLGLRALTSPVTALIALPRQRVAALQPTDGVIIVWDLEGATEVARFSLRPPEPLGIAKLIGPPVPEKPYLSMDFLLWQKGVGVLGLNDGQIAIWDRSHTVEVWDPDTRTVTARLSGDTPSLWGVVCLSDGRLVCAASDHTLRIWDHRYGIEVRRLEGHATEIAEAAAGSGDRLVSGSRDSVCVFDVDSPEPLRAKAVYDDGPTNVLAATRELVLTTTDDWLFSALNLDITGSSY